MPFTKKFFSRYIKEPELFEPIFTNLRPPKIKEFYLLEQKDSILPYVGSDREREIQNKIIKVSKQLGKELPIPTVPGLGDSNATVCEISPTSLKFRLGFLLLTDILGKIEDILTLLFTMIVNLGYGLVKLCAKAISFLSKIDYVLIASDLVELFYKAKTPSQKSPSHGENPPDGSWTTGHYAGTGGPK